MFLSSEPYEPSLSDSAFEVPILSDPASLTQLDLSTLENQTFEQDIPTPIRNTLNYHDETSSSTHSGKGTVRLADIYPSMELMEQTVASPIIEEQPFKLESLKIEEPLTPPLPLPIPKSVHFSDIVEEMLLDPPSSPSSDPFRNTHFEEAFGDAAERVTRQLDQESLIPADATGRVEVPLMDFSFPDPPWKKPMKAQGATILYSIAIIKDVIGEGFPIWPGQNRGHGKLKWNPFPHDLAKVAQKENYPEDDNTWKPFLNGPENDQIIDTSSLTWKAPGLKILKEDDDEEIESSKYQSNGSQDIFLLARKRRMELEREGKRFSRQNPAKSAELNMPVSGASPLGKRNTPKSNDNLPISQKLQNNQTGSDGFGLLMGGAFSAENALDNFLELRGIKKQKLTSSSHFQNNNKQASAQVQTTQAEPQNQPAEELRLLETSMNTPRPLPVPVLSLPAGPISAIIASSLLKRRTLIEHIESQIPGLKLIERDFKAHNTTAWVPNSVTRSPIASPLDSEADLIVSPSTGIVLTTLQKIKQKPLPGQKTKPAIRDRLERASGRYEKLVVLVSEGRVDESTNGLDENNCNAICEFVGFTSGLEATILVLFVGGGEKTLSKWLMNSIVQHAAASNSLLEEETHWELFLRRVGMNAYAAQSMAAAAKAYVNFDPHGNSDAGQSGLAAFVRMERQQRVDTFGQICGRRLLERVGACLEATWV